MKYLVRDKIFAIGDDYWIEDERGRHAFLVDGKALRLRDTLELKDPDGQVLITLRQKVFSLRDTMTVERDERPLATVRRKRLSLLRNHYRVTLVDGTELDVSGRILDREFIVEYEGELLAHISRQWFRIRDTYAVNVVREDADPALQIAVAVCVIRMSEREREE
ncbi:LURP-one-related/scramblase family protein [Streptomyces sp. NPDC058872]|uniref:LURP-one-related/scramblase family protein n=1 Tax=Streptomyces sp. NPDC058872 TaxID=3346661 RepID=UPI003695738D